MLTIVNGFERLRTEYESCRNFHEIYAELKDGIARKFDGFIPHDGYLFLNCKLCIPRKILCLKIVC